MKRFPYIKGEEFIGARYEFEHPEFGEDRFTILTNELEQVLSEIPDDPDRKVEGFYFIHPIYDITMPIKKPKTVRELKESLSFFAHREDNLHQLYVMTF